MRHPHKTTLRQRIAAARASWLVVHSSPWQKTYGYFHRQAGHVVRFRNASYIWSADGCLCRL